jgi:hypothetical protein
MAEPRSAVMIVADAWWEGPDGSLQKGSARIVNKSRSGACVRVKTRIAVGSKVRIQSRWDEFSGSARYCRSDGQQYLVGIQRETGEKIIPKQTADTVPNRDGRERTDNRLEEPPVELAEVAQIVTSAPPVEGREEVATEVLAPKVSYRKSMQRRWRSSQYRGARPPQRLEARAKSPLEEYEVQMERGKILMELNWMGRGKRGSGGEDPNEEVSAVSGGADERNKPAASVVAAPAKKERVAPAVDGDLAYQNELLPLEEIYAAAGIVSPRRGYTIKKVMEMLRSEHLSALSKEMRRASVMMALDAAGISVDEVLRDAQVRLEAINSYEAEQKKLCEAEWARKAEEHVQLKEELEQVRARFMERMKQTLDGIARDRARFGSWLTTMHEESQSISEAAELCLKAASPPAATSGPPAAVEMKETGIKVG